VGRGTESQEVINARLQRAAEESEGILNYDYILVNDELDTAVETLHQIIQSEHNRLDRNKAFVEEICREAMKLK
jgi:guanylate kinase